MAPEKEWPRAPVHRIGSDGIYMVTGATLRKVHLFNGGERLSLLENELLTLAKQYRWHFQAWAVFGNHYHLIARGQPEASRLDAFLKHLHSNSARTLNSIDGLAGRQVWFNFWDTKLTFERSYLARLNYVHQNPVKHGLV